MMNIVALKGRLTKSPDVRYTTGDKPMCIARFTLAVQRTTKNKEGAHDADFISCKALGKTGETIEKYVVKGQEICVTGHIETGSYEKEGRKVFTTDVVVDKFDFCGKRGEAEADTDDNPIPQGFSKMDDDIPF